jgi:type VI secretion system protein ImpF
MSDPRGIPRVRLPLFDRLLDADPNAPNDPPLSASLALDTLRAAVRRDLEALLNARRRRLPPPEALVELPVSPVGYGIPDATAGSFTEESRRNALAREVEATIRRFEPRLTDISVTAQKSEQLDRSLRLKIEAVLRTDPVPEAVTFETVVRTNILDVVVREGG